jgi:hypothetical protein
MNVERVEIFSSALVVPLHIIKVLISVIKNLETFAAV